MENLLQALFNSDPLTEDRYLNIDPKPYNPKDDTWPNFVLESFIAISGRWSGL